MLKTYRKSHFRYLLRLLCNRGSRNRKQSADMGKNAFNRDN